MERLSGAPDSHSPWQRSACTLLALLALLSGTALAGRPVFADGPKAVKAVAEPAGHGSADKEKAALEFASEHHSELGDLLKNLKRSNRGAYDKGIHQLYRDSERLARTRTNNPARYDLEIELWKTESRIRLTAARTMMDESRDSLKEDLRELIAHREEVKLRILKQSRERLSAQLSKIDSDIASAETGREARIERELESLLKSPKKRDVRAINSAKKLEAKEGAKPDTSKTTKPEGKEVLKPSEKTGKPKADDRDGSVSRTERS